MKKYNGITLNTGAAIGHIRSLILADPDRDFDHEGDPVEELGRFETVRIKVIEEQHALYDKVIKESGEETARIFDMYELLLNDEGLLSSCKTYIEEGKHLAEYAIIHGFNDKAAKLRAVPDPYISSRANDIIDLRDELLKALLTEEKDYLSGSREKDDPAEPVILLVDDLTAGDVARLDRSGTAGIIFRKGSLTSHAAILIREMNIPAIIQCADIPSDLPSDSVGVLDADFGCAYIDPDKRTLRKYTDKIAADQIDVNEVKGKPAVTLDGYSVKLFANIGGAEDIASALENDAEGIGLFRTEFMCFDDKADRQGVFPSEEEQFEVYKEVLEKMGSAQTVIRVFDIGSDKMPESHVKEDNPALGLRGVRFLLMHKTFFKDQLRALIRASEYGNLGILLPMVSTLDELKKCREILKECMQELENRDEGTGKTKKMSGKTSQNKGYADIRLGVMIETPAAALMADEFAKEADFFSIGTNDLIQYTYATDRTNGSVTESIDPGYGAVLKLVKMSIDAAHDNNIPVGICGELGSDRTLTGEFLKMGTDYLSVNPGNILSVKDRIRKTDLSGGAS